ncbi:uncharacterized protein N7498_008782 [Penicillium cinerascens]|uniref:DNL-type domain-containing protein n=1 Tax=Penicillium cinerascens TaxID=70096 RepID=A0A9W9JE57_9EURO|nr:uncharacterized protein N7498_008782 [Penicillium cinerascens]KAJ5195344.1 hypothetical protein N7498_008782 [Penicillium cinerascens]
MRPFAQGLRPVRSLLSYTSLTSTRSPSSRLFSQLSQVHHALSKPSLARPARILPLNTIRHNSTSRPLTKDPASRNETDAEREAKNAERRKNEEAYRITFTCKPCGERSSHRMSKQGYHRGTVLIQCPSCQNRHVMSDHLGVFFDKGTTLEDLLKQKGQALTHGRTDGDLEFWEDGTVKSFDLEGQELLGSAGKETAEKVSS